MFYLVIVALILLAAALFLANSGQKPVVRKKTDSADIPGWEYGNVWEHGSPDESLLEDDVPYVEILRGDTGTGYDDSYMLELIGYLASRGVRSTYDAVPLAMEAGGAIKAYVLRVEAGKEDEALRYLQEKEAGRG
jgi:hypothetical protein